VVVQGAAAAHGSGGSVGGVAQMRGERGGGDPAHGAAASCRSDLIPAPATTACEDAPQLRVQVGGDCEAGALN